MQSIVQQRGAVLFPAHLGERIYMRAFFKADGLPIDLRRWQDTVDAMLHGVETDQPIYLMVDQGVVRAGDTHRRPGLHIDGYWNPTLQAHGGHVFGGHTGGWRTGPDWLHCELSAPEAIILASDISACRAFEGEWAGVPGEGGDCQHINVDGMREVVLNANMAYAGNVAMLHESTPVLRDTLRTVVRLNVPGWSPELAPRYAL